MNFLKTMIDGVYIVQQDVHKDGRGSFVKNFQKKEFLSKGLEHDFKESYYTRSKEDVIRGMHFQLAPYDHAKLVTIIQGTIVDVILDLRKNSPTFKKHISVELSRENRKSIYIPKGCAHGFSVLSDSAIAYYMTTVEYEPKFDKGIRFDSFGYDWGIPNPILSDRDINFPPLDLFTEFF